MTFGERLRQIREARGPSERELAEAIGMSCQAIGLYEADERERDLATIQKLAHALNTSISYPLGKTDGPSPLPPIAAHREQNAGGPLRAGEQMVKEWAARNAIQEITVRDGCSGNGRVTE